ncbi:MAG: malto-oligosyltrehalose synthase, partial [Pseudomonadota bacterium]
NRFLVELDELARQMARFGFVNSLAQTLCKLTAAGVPDIYQGNELWDDSLVDPDNRRAVNYELRRQMLEEVRAWWTDPGALAARLLEPLSNLDDGRCKLHLIARVLDHRREHEALFREGRYLPLRVRGEHAAHVIAFARLLGEEWAISVVPRLCVRLHGGLEGVAGMAAPWRDTRVVLPARLPGGVSVSHLDGRTVVSTPEGAESTLAVSDLLAHFPVALVVPG